MKPLSLFRLFIVFQSICCIISSKTIYLASSAINGVLEEYFAKNLAKVDLIYYGSENGASEILVKEIVRSRKDSVSIKVYKGVKNVSKEKLSQSTLLTFDSVQNFKAVFKEIKWQRNPKRRKRHLVYIHNATIADLSNIQDGFSIDYVSFLLSESETSIDLVTSFMFTPNACRKIQFKTINRFHRNTMKWETSTFYPKKYGNLKPG